MVIDNRPKAAPVRMVPKFVNGVWTVFDTVFFDHGPDAGLAKRARDIAAEMNAAIPAPKVAHRAQVRR